MVRWLIAMCLSILAAAGVTAAAPPVALTVPDRVSSNASITAAGDVVAVAWGAATEQGATDIYAVISNDAGLTFGPPVRVSATSDAQISGEQPPRVAVVPGPRGETSVVVVWTAKGVKGTRLMTSRSADGGRSFGDVTTVPGSEAAGNRGWESIAAEPDGRVAALWIDHRETAPTAASPVPTQHDGSAHTGHTGLVDGATRALLSKLYFGRIDGSEAPQVVAAGMCYCCKTTVAAVGGSLYAAWRHVYPGNIRDIAFTSSHDAGRTFATPVRVSEDKWVLDGCPENGPALAVGSGGRVHLVWPTLVSGATPGSEPALAMFYATSGDGRRFSPRQRLATEGTPYHPQIALNEEDGSLLVVWDELRGGRRRAVAARGSIDAGGATFVREEILAAGLATHPVVAATRHGFVVGWTDTSTVPSRIVVQRLP